jgi:hypothetical protein
VIAFPKSGRVDAPRAGDAYGDDSITVIESSRSHDARYRPTSSRSLQAHFTNTMLCAGSEGSLTPRHAAAADVYATQEGTICASRSGSLNNLISAISPRRTVKAMTEIGRSFKRTEHAGGAADGDGPQDSARPQPGLRPRSRLGGNLVRAPNDSDSPGAEGLQFGVRRQHREQRGQVTGPGGSEEGVDDGAVVSLAGSCCPWNHAHASTGAASEHLHGVR